MHASYACMQTVLARVRCMATAHACIECEVLRCACIAYMHESAHACMHASKHIYACLVGKYSLQTFTKGLRNVFSRALVEERRRVRPHQHALVHALHPGPDDVGTLHHLEGGQFVPLQKVALALLDGVAAVCMRCACKVWYKLEAASSHRSLLQLIPVPDDSLGL